MKHLLIIVLLLCNFSIYAQINENDIRIAELIRDIAEKNELLSRGIGAGGSPTHQYKRFEELKQLATTNDLIAYTNHENAVVRCYAFWALCDRQEERLFKIVLEHLNDTAIVSKTFGCLMSRVTVADFYISLISRKYLITEDYYRQNHSLITSEKKRLLDSLILYEYTNLEYLDRILNEIEPNPHDYHQIKKIVQDGNYIALGALARYQKEEDIDLILSYKDREYAGNERWYRTRNLYKAIEYFPHPRFSDYLDNVSKSFIEKKEVSSSREPFYYAVAAHQNDEALKILNRPFNTKDIELKYHKRAISKAISKYPCEKYEELMFYLWQEHLFTSKGSFEYLVKKYPDKTFQILESYLDNFDEVYSKDIYQEEVLPVVLSFAYDYNQEKTIELIAKNLEEISITPYQQFFRFAKAHSNEVYIESSFKRIENTNVVFFEEVEILMDFKRQDIEDRLIEIAEREGIDERKSKDIKDHIRWYKKKNSNQ